MSLFKKKPISELMLGADREGSLKRTLSITNILAFGLGAVSGAGLFMRTGTAIAYHAGAGVILSFILAAVACGLAALCYAEMASVVPVAGSAYAYTYATMGEFLAWIVGWDLILEYGVGAAAIAIGWSEYLNHWLRTIGLHIPYAWSHSPLQSDPLTHVNGIVNLPAFLIIALLTVLLIRGTQQSVIASGFSTLLKFLAIFIFIILGWKYTHPLPYHEFFLQSTSIRDAEGIQTHFGGFPGILGAAGIVFFAFIGFDAISTTAQEAKNPSRDIPRAILGAVGICAILFTLFAFVLVCITNISELRAQGREATVAIAAEHLAQAAHAYRWLPSFLTIAALVGFSASILIMLFGQSRILYAMSHDGLLPKGLSTVNRKYSTPIKANLVGLTLCGILAALVPVDIVGEITSIGTLFSFMLVCASTWLLRKRNDYIARPFKVPGLPFVAGFGILICGLLILGLGWTNWLRLGVWLVVGQIVYFAYSRKRSRVKEDDSSVLNLLK